MNIFGWVQSIFRSWTQRLSDSFDDCSAPAARRCHAASVVMQIETISDVEANPHGLTQIRQLCDLAFNGEFGHDDWAHALGGQHVVARLEGTVIGHTAVVTRRITIDGAPFNSGYVEAVATHPDAQASGVGTAVMTAVNDIVRQWFDLGVLSTSAHHFYERLGWERWQGPTSVRRSHGIVRTEDEDDGIMVLVVGPGRAVATTGEIMCEERTGDDW